MRSGPASFKRVLTFFAAWTAIAPAFAGACDFCGLPLLAKHRSGPFTVTIAADRPSYRVGTEPRIVVTITNRGTQTLFVDPATPITAQSSLHVAGPQSGVSQADVPVARARTHAIRPGRSFTFRSPGGRGGTPLSAWTGVAWRRPGIYAVDLTYANVDSPAIVLNVSEGSK